MEMWTNLGIEKTKDIDAITEAYHEKLKLVHPEEKPEEFMALRAEYEEAIKYAQQNDETEEKEKTPIDIWLEKADAIYCEYSSRVDLSAWSELLKDDVCQSLDMRIDARNALLRLTMKNSSLPMSVWKLLDDEFSLKENKESLYEIFPKDYIDNCVISGMDNPPVVPYELFAEGTTGNIDCYFDLHYKARNEIREKNPEAAEATIADIEKTGFVHPYTDVLRARIAMGRDEFDKALEIIEPLCEKYPEDIGIRGQRGDIFYCADRFNEALNDYEFILEKGHKGSRYVQSQCYMHIGEYIKAKDILVELCHDFPFESAFKTAFDEACQKATEMYEQKYNEGTLSVDEQIDYAWSYVQSDNNDKAREIIESIKPETLAQKCDLKNISSKFYNNVGEFETSLQHALEWEELVRQLPDGETEEEKKRKNKLDDICYVQASALAKLERYDEALEKTAQSIEAGPQRASEAHDLRRYIFRSIKKDYMSAMHEAEKMVEVKPGSWTHFILGYEQYELGMLQDAFNNFGESLEYTLELECYIYRIRILCDVGQWDGAKDIIKFLEEHGINDSDTINYCKARILEKETGSEEDEAEALKMYYAIIENIENGNSDVNFAYEVYYRAAELDTSKSNEERLALVNKGLESRHNYYDLLYLKTTLLENLRRYKEAIEVYEHIDAEYPNRYNLNVCYANNYYDLKDYEKALEYYTKRCETNESGGIYDMMGLCLLYLDRYDEAIETFKKGIAIEPDLIRPYTNLGLTYEYKFDFESAIEYHKQASALNDSKEEKDRRIYVNRALARALARAGRAEEAAEAYRKNLAMFGRDDDARFVIEVYIEAGMLDKTLEYIKKYKERGQITSVQELLMTADVYRLQGNYKHYYKTISKLPDDNSFKYNRLGRYELHEGKYKKALECIKKMEEMDGNEDISFFNDRLFCLRRLGDSEAVNKLLEHALDVLNNKKWDKDEDTLRITKYALVYTAAGQPAMAKPYIDKAMNAPLCEHCRYGKCKDAYLALAEYYEAIGEYDKAIETCREGKAIAFDEYDFTYIADRVRKEHKKELKKENR